MFPTTRLLSPTLGRFCSFGVRTRTVPHPTAIMGATAGTTTTAATKSFKNSATNNFKSSEHKSILLPMIPRVHEVDPAPNHNEIPIYRIPLTEKSSEARETVYKQLHLGLLELRGSILFHTTAMLDKPLVNWPTFCYFLRQERIFGLSPDNIGDDLERLLSPNFLRTKATETRGPYTLVLMHWMQLSGMDYRAWYKFEEMFANNDCSLREACQMNALGAPKPEEANLELIVKGMQQGLLDRGMGDREEMKWMVREVLKAVPRVRTMGWDWE